MNRDEKNYYEAPSEEVFNEVREMAIKVWVDNYEDDFGYVTKKVSRINAMGNIEDNVMFIIGMFDDNNQDKLAELLSVETKQIIRQKLLSVDNNWVASKFM